MLVEVIISMSKLYRGASLLTVYLGGGGRLIDILIMLMCKFMKS